MQCLSYMQVQRGDGLCVKDPPTAAQLECLLLQSVSTSSGFFISITYKWAKAQITEIQVPLLLLSSLISSVYRNLDGLNLLVQRLIHLMELDNHILEKKAQVSPKCSCLVQL